MSKTDIIIRGTEPGDLILNDSNDGDMAASVNVSVRLVVLNTSLVGVFNKGTVTDDKAEKKPKKVTSEVLVMPTDSPKGGMTITELIDGVNQMIKDFSDTGEKVNEADVKEKIDMVCSGGVLSKIKVELRQIFIYRKQVDTYLQNAEGKYGDKPDKVEKSLEYAVNFVITSTISNNTVFNITSVSLAVWNTARPKIVDRMELGDINKLLND